MGQRCQKPCTQQQIQLPQDFDPLEAHKLAREPFVSTMEAALIVLDGALGLAALVDCTTEVGHTCI